MKILDKFIDFYHHHPIFDHWPPFFKFEVFASFCYCFWTFFQPNWGADLTWFPAFTTGVTVYVIISMNNTTDVVHFNPAITLSFLAAGELSLLKALWYILGQVLGGFLAGIIAWPCFIAQFAPNQTFVESFSHDTVADSVVKLYALDVPDSLKVAPGLVTEMFFSLFMCIAALSAVYNKTFSDATGPLMVGFNVFLGIGSGTKVGAGCLNPLRSAAPWLFHPVYIGRNWIFMVGPFLGALLSAILWRYKFKEHDDHEEKFAQMQRVPAMYQDHDLHNPFEGLLANDLKAGRTHSFSDLHSFETEETDQVKKDQARKIRKLEKLHRFHLWEDQDFRTHKKHGDTEGLLKQKNLSE